ncbi:MAG: hypothetical protein B6U65_02905 [Candidatus Wolframiiraptor sp. EX4484-121]|nr:MAG: hypothetical protein B6U65_02905 [Candidatus Wolframiiraptor sp. EX4484-121]
MPQKLTNLEERAIRLLLKHEKKGMVKRVKEFAKDRWTRRLIPLIREVKLDPIRGAPCLSCEYEHICGREGKIKPENCPKLESWVLESYRSSLKKSSKR